MKASQKRKIVKEWNRGANATELWRLARQIVEPGPAWNDVQALIGELTGPDGKRRHTATARLNEFHQKPRSERQARRFVRKLLREEGLAVRPPRRRIRMPRVARMPRRSVAVRSLVAPRASSGIRRPRRRAVHSSPRKTRAGDDAPGPGEPHRGSRLPLTLVLVAVEARIRAYVRRILAVAP